MSTADNQLTAMQMRFRWILVCPAGMATAGVLARPLSYVVGETVGGVLGEVPAEAAIGAVARGRGAPVDGLRTVVSTPGTGLVGRSLAGGGCVRGRERRGRGFRRVQGSLPGRLGNLGAALAVVAGLGAFLAADWLALRGRIPRAFGVGAASAGGFVALYGTMTMVTLGRLTRTDR